MAVDDGDASKKPDEIKSYQDAVAIKQSKGAKADTARLKHNRIPLGEELSIVVIYSQFQGTGILMILWGTLI